MLLTANNQFSQPLIQKEYRCNILPEKFFCNRSMKRDLRPLRHFNLINCLFDCYWKCRRLIHSNSYVLKQQNESNKRKITKYRYKHFDSLNSSFVQCIIFMKSESNRQQQQQHVHGEQFYVHFHSGLGFNNTTFLQQKSICNARKFESIFTCWRFV